MKSGIYRIVNKVNGKYYIGSSVNIEKRYKRHINELRKGTHHSILLQRAYDKYGEVEFELEVLEIINDTDLIKIREQEILDTSDYSVLYNVSKSASGGDLISNHPNLDKIKADKSRIMKERISKMSDSERIKTFGRNSEQNGMFNRVHSPHSRSKMSRKLMYSRVASEGKTYEELYGYEKAQKMKDNLSYHASKRVGEKKFFLWQTPYRRDKEKVICIC